MRNRLAESAGSGQQLQDEAAAAEVRGSRTRRIVGVVARCDTLNRCQVCNVRTELP